MVVTNFIFLLTKNSFLEWAFEGTCIYAQIRVAFLLLAYSKHELRSGNKSKLVSIYCGADFVNVLYVCAH